MPRSRSRTRIIIDCYPGSGYCSRFRANSSPSYPYIDEQQHRRGTSDYYSYYMYSIPPKTYQTQHTSHRSPPSPIPSPPVVVREEDSTGTCSLCLESPLKYYPSASLGQESRSRSRGMPQFSTASRQQSRGRAQKRNHRHSRAPTPYPAEENSRSASFKSRPASWPGDTARHSTAFRSQSRGRTQIRGRPHYRAPTPYPTDEEHFSSSQNRKRSSTSSRRHSYSQPQSRGHDGAPTSVRPEYAEMLPCGHIFGHRCLRRYYHAQQPYRYPERLRCPREDCGLLLWYPARDCRHMIYPFPLTEENLEWLVRQKGNWTCRGRCAKCDGKYRIWMRARSLPRDIYGGGVAREYFGYY